MKTRYEVQEELNVLKAKLNEKQKELNAMKWKPRNTINYVLHSCDKISRGNLHTNYDRYIENGQTFETERRAKHAAKVYKSFHLLYKLAEELNQSDTSTVFNHWSIEYLGDTKKLVAVRLTEAQGGLLPRVYFKTKDLALQAIEIIENGGLE